MENDCRHGLLSPPPHNFSIPPSPPHFVPPPFLPLSGSFDRAKTASLSLSPPTKKIPGFSPESLEEEEERRLRRDEREEAKKAAVFLGKTAAAAAAAAAPPLLTQ